MFEYIILLIIYYMYDIINLLLLHYIIYIYFFFLYWGIFYFIYYFIIIILHLFFYLSLYQAAYEYRKKYLIYISMGMVGQIVGEVSEIYQIDEQPICVDKWR